MEQKTIGKSKEDYLKAILIVLKEHGACRNVDVSNRLGVSKSSTCIAIKKLEQDGFVKRGDWRILLTEKGRVLSFALHFSPDQIYTKPMPVSYFCMFL